MKHEFEHLSISDQDDIDDELDAQICRLRDKIADVLMNDDEPVPTEVALSIFATMYVRTAHDMMELPLEVAKLAINSTLDLHYADDEGEGKWLN